MDGRSAACLHRRLRVYRHHRYMRMLALLSKNSETLPGRTGTARVDRDSRRLLARIGPGDIAVLDEMDIDQSLADKLVAAGVTAVVNTSPSISGRYPRSEERRVGKERRSRRAAE